ncbi:MAG: 50S ribosomal protein L18 [Lachnospiraceae bacterium]|nr:50S ribosomal protein L18 [Lachnospiraceae bacterium]
MVNKKSRQEVRLKKHKRMRNTLAGTAEKPRMSVFRSNLNMYVQIIDDTAGVTLVSASTLDADVKSKVEYTDNTEAATLLGTIIAEKAKKKGITTVVFDRSGYLYHGKIAALADAAREAGLEF